jgi:hypothetical protein
MNKIVELFKGHSVSVSGKKGTGKDLLFSNVVARRGGYYISNVDYKAGKPCLFRDPARRIELDFRKLKTGNTYREFLSGDVKKYVYPYPDGTDIYISDCGIIFPCQYNERLNREYEDIISFIALSRQLGDCRVHTNAQALNRVWDKLREQSDTYIVCQWAKVFFGKIVVQKVRIYDRYESAEKNVPPFMKIPLFCSPTARQTYNLMRDSHKVQYGEIQERLLIYVHHSNYDTRAFKTILDRGAIYDDQK